MFHRFNMIRMLAVPACLLWATAELIALQRVRFTRRKVRSLAGTVKNI